MWQGKKQELLIKATTDKGNKLQNELDQTKNEMTIQQKEYHNLLNHQQLQRKYLKTVVQPKKLRITNLKKSSNEMNIPSKIYDPT